MKKLLMPIFLVGLFCSDLAAQRVLVVPDPFERLEKWWDESLRGVWGDEGITYRRKMYPPMDVVAKNDTYVIKVQAAGFDKDDFNIEVEPRRVIISVEKKKEVEKKEEKYYRKEISYESFRRVVHLTEEVQTDPHKIKAVYEDGILTITIPKEKKAEKKSIKIKVR